jgi:hypothetical protein
LLCGLADAAHCFGLSWVAQKPDYRGRNLIGALFNCDATAAANEFTARWVWANHHRYGAAPSIQYDYTQGFGGGRHAQNICTGESVRGVGV